MNTPSFSLNFAYAHAFADNLQSGQIKTTNADFQVTENLQTAFTGEGEHTYLWIEKDGENTHWLAKQLAEFAGVKPEAIGFSGLKDRNAITWQWFSVHLPKNPAINWQAFNSPSWNILRVERHRQKLRRGDHQSNDFKIRIRFNNTTIDKTPIETLITTASEQGVPNYFGPQRFGRNGANLDLAQEWFVNGKKIKNRRERGLVLSAARSYLFNELLSQRVQKGVWRCPVEGDVLIDQLPSGPLWGRGRLATQAIALQYEQALNERFDQWCLQLEHQGLAQERRPLVLMPENFDWQWLDGDLQLQFTLATGQYATTLLREIIVLVEASFSAAE